MRVEVNPIELACELANGEFLIIYEKDHDIETATEEENDTFNKMYDEYLSRIMKVSTPVTDSYTDMDEDDLKPME